MPRIQAGQTPGQPLVEPRSNDPAGMRTIDPGYKLAKSIKIAMLYLEDDDPVNAELFIKKASALIAANKVGTIVLVGRPGGWATTL